MKQVHFFLNGVESGTITTLNLSQTRSLHRQRNVNSLNNLVLILDHESTKVRRASWIVRERHEVEIPKNGSSTSLEDIQGYYEFFVNWPKNRARLREAWTGISMFRLAVSFRTLFLDIYASTLNRSVTKSVRDRTRFFRIHRISVYRDFIIIVRDIRTLC